MEPILKADLVMWLLGLPVAALAIITTVQLLVKVHQYLVRQPKSGEVQDD